MLIFLAGLGAVAVLQILEFSLTTSFFSFVTKIAEDYK